jgi:hypothetical protein
MAKKRRRKYSRGSGEEVRREMHRYKRGRAKSGRGGKGGKVKSRKQAIAIALSKARKKGKKVPRKKRFAFSAAREEPHRSEALLGDKRYVRRGSERLPTRTSRPGRNLRRPIALS